jgi:flagellar basal-body rod protein FlgB
MDLPGTDRITSLLSTFLSVQSRRAQLSASNVANADTPGYAAQELDFAEFLRTAARDALSVEGVAGRSPATAERPRVIPQLGNGYGLDGNNVDVQREMTTLAEAGMQYLAGTQLLQSRLRTLRTAIREGR